MRKKLNLKQENKGFTLVEMVISVAFLAVISIFLLKLFISADNLALKAKDLDQGVAVARQVIETFKACQLPEEFQSAGIMKDAAVTESGTSGTLILRFDQEWKPISGAAREDVAFTLEAAVAPDTGGTESMAVQGTYQIDVKIMKTEGYLLEENSGTEIFSASALKYFSRLNTKKQ